MLHEASVAGMEAASLGADQFLTFSSAGRTMALDIMVVREIRGWSPPTPLPGQAPGTTGVLNIRGRVVPVFDLAVMLGAATKTPESGVILIVTQDNSDVGLHVEAVSDIIFADAEDIRPVPAESLLGPSMVHGMIEKSDALIALLNISSMLTSERAEVVYLD